MHCRLACRTAVIIGNDRAPRGVNKSLVTSVPAIYYYRIILCFIWTQTSLLCGNNSIGFFQPKSPMATVKKCIFCNQDNLAILFQVCLLLASFRGTIYSLYIYPQDLKYAIFKDIHPATEHHLLVIPKEHIANPKYLTKKDIPLSKCYMLTLAYTINTNCCLVQSKKWKLLHLNMPNQTFPNLMLET